MVKRNFYIRLEQKILPSIDDRKKKKGGKKIGHCYLRDKLCCHISYIVIEDFNSSFKCKGKQ